LASRRQELMGRGPHSQFVEDCLKLVEYTRDANFP